MEPVQVVEEQLIIKLQKTFSHSEYEELTSEKKNYLIKQKKCERIVCHFYRNSTKRCKIVDKHLETKFVKLSVDRVPFITERLHIKILPTIVLLIDNISLIDLGNHDGFSTEILEWRLGKSGVIDYKDESQKMNDINLSSQNASTRRVYQRRNRKNRTNISPPAYLSLTTTIATTNSTLIINSSSVPINDLFAPISYLTQYKYVFIIGLSLLILLCIISILFLIVILKCTRRKSWKTRRQERLDKKRLKDLPDFLDDQHGNKGENEILLEQNGRTNSSINNTITTNGILSNDNISNTFSLDPMLEQKIIKNNPPNTISLSPMADDTSLDTLRGSLISSPSQQISSIQPPSTPTYITTTDSIINPEEHAFEAEKEDDLHDLDLKPIQPRYIKATNNSSSNLPAHRTSASSIEQSIRRQERRAEEEERGLLHGSNSNLYEKELRKQAEQEAFARKHTNSQVSLVSRTSEDSCY